tara:strand:+ start:557 stop:754 length:198 start_codon:yes stop_codon:yes gene_type:complete
VSSSEPAVFLYIYIPKGITMYSELIEENLPRVDADVLVSLNIQEEDLGSDSISGMIVNIYRNQGE